MIHLWGRHPLAGLDAVPPLDDYPEPMRAQIALLRARLRRRKIVSSVFNAIVCAVIACALVGAAWLIALATDDAVPTLTTVGITTFEVPPGGDLVMDVFPRILRRCEGQVVFRLFDREGNSINRSETAWGYPVAHICPETGTCPDPKFVRRLRISSDAVPSRLKPDGTLVRDARMRIERKFYCNPVQRQLERPIIEVPPDLTFAIAPASRP